MCSQWNQINNEITQFKFVNQKNSTFEFHLESLQVKDMNIAFSKTFAFSNFRQLLFLFLIQPAPSLMPFFPAYPSLQTFVTQILSSPHSTHSIPYPSLTVPIWPASLPYLVPHYLLVKFHNLQPLIFFTNYSPVSVAITTPPPTGSICLSTPLYLDLLIVVR